jgi:dUTP pyrophosphatase
MSSGSYLKNMTVKVINRSNNPLPSYETIASAGMDLRAFLPDGNIILKPLERSLISTGLFIELPAGHEAQIRPRSGLALKYGITILNSPGTIDADYRGEIKVLLINFSDSEFIVSTGDRIAQMIVSSHETVKWDEVQLLNETARGSGGSGHTGI